MGAKLLLQNGTPPPGFNRSVPNFTINKVVMGEYKVMDILPIFVNTGSYGAGNFETLLLLQFWSDVAQTLW